MHLGIYAYLHTSISLSIHIYIYIYIYIYMFLYIYTGVHCTAYVPLSAARAGQAYGAQCLRSQRPVQHGAFFGP